MPNAQVVPLRSEIRTAPPKADASRLLAALGVTLREMPPRPAGLAACVAHLQEEPGRVAARPIAVRGLQKFHESLFHSPGREPEMRQLWREALATACHARVLAGAMQLDAALLTGAGLLHRLDDVLALRAIAEAEFRSGQRVIGPVMQELATARDPAHVNRAIAAWALTDPLRDLLTQWRQDHSVAHTSESSRLLAVAPLLGFELVHAGRSTPFAAEMACEEMHFPVNILDQARANAAGIGQLLLRAAPPMGPVSLASARSAPEPASAGLAPQPA